MVISFKQKHCVLFAYILFTFSDFYFKGIGRLFDYVGLFFIILSILLSKKITIKYSRNFLCIYFSLLAVIVFYAVMGMVNQNYLAALSIIVGSTIVFMYVLNLDVNEEMLGKVLNFLVIINVTVFFLQFLLYHYLGIVLDINKAIGSIHARVFELGLLRPAGLFQEPNSYCVNMFMLLVLRFRLQQQNKIITWVGCITMVISHSLWGMGGVLFIICFFFQRKEIIFALLFFLVAVLILSYNPAFISSLQNSLFYTVFHNRVLHLSNDASRQARYGSFDNYITMDNIFGNGITTSDFQSIAANGIAFNIYCFGLSGFLLFFVSLAMFFIRKRSVKFFLALCFLITTDEIFTFMIFWAWFGFLIKFTYERNKLQRNFIHNRKLAAY